MNRILIASLLLIGCSSSESTHDDLGTDASAKLDGSTTDDLGPDTDAGPSTDAGGTDAAVAQRIAVLSSDYSSTVLSLVAASGTALGKDDCLDSGSTSTKLSEALSGDVVLGGVQPNGDVLLIDRKNAALDWVNPTTCTVDAQLSVSTGFDSNPHAVIPVSATKAYVTRYAPNTAGGTSAANNQGDDILIIDPTAQTVTGHIDVTSFEGVGLLARPDVGIFANGKAWVTLDNQSADFMTTGTAVLVSIDPTTDLPTSFSLAPYKNCLGLDYEATDKTLLVSCTGDYDAALTDQVAESALVLLDISGTTPTITKAIPATALGSYPIGTGVFAGSILLATTVGDFTGTTHVNDRVWAVTKAGVGTKVTDAGAAGDFGSLVYLPATQTALLSDGNMTTPLVRVYTVGSTVTQSGSFVSNPKSGLPPRVLSSY